MRVWIPQPDGTFKVVVAMGLLDVGTPNMRIITLNGVEACPNVSMIFEGDKVN